MSGMIPEIKLLCPRNTEYLEPDGSKRRFEVFFTLQSLLGRSGCNGLPQIWLTIELSWQVQMELVFQCKLQRRNLQKCHSECKFSNDSGYQFSLSSSIRASLSVWYELWSRMKSCYRETSQLSSKLEFWWIDQLAFEARFSSYCCNIWQTPISSDGTGFNTPRRAWSTLFHVQRV